MPNRSVWHPDAPAPGPRGDRLPPESADWSTGWDWFRPRNSKWQRVRAPCVVSRIDEVGALATRPPNVVVRNVVVRNVVVRNKVSARLRTTDPERS